MTSEQRLEILERHVNELAEIYDSVQIVASWVAANGTTSSHKRGSGNWYARQGMCSEFVEENKDDNAAALIAKHLDPPDDWKDDTTA